MDRDEFMELVYETFADEPDNVLANGIIEAADAYAEHEKAQLSCEGTTSDRISRIDTISVLEIFTQTDTLGHTPKQIVEALPSAEPERKKGKWIYSSPNGFKCSECGGYLEIGFGTVKMNFCPNCGSYNGGEQK